MKIAYIRWRDARSEEAVDPFTNVVPALCELHEVGFLLAEDDQAVTIGMEMDADGETAPGRWRLHVPRAMIREMRIIELSSILRRKKK